MWNKPSLVTDVVAEKIWSFISPELWDISFASADKSDEAALLLIEWFNATIQLLRSSWDTSLVSVTQQMQTATSSQEFDLTKLPQSFADAFGEYIQSETEKLSQRRRFDLVADVSCRSAATETVLTDAGAPMAGEVGRICGLLAMCVIALLGSESTMLIGTANNVPAYKRINRVKNGEEATEYVVNTMLVTFGLLARIREDAARLVPSYDKFTVTAHDVGATGDEYFEVNRVLIEDAFYRQRYIVDPEGAYVRLTNAKSVTSLFLKVRSAGKGSLVEIMARIETTEGSCFTLVDEERLLNPSSDRNVYPSIGSYFAYLVCQIYHDLVTAEVVPTSPESEPRPLGEDRIMSERDGHIPSWIVIPRKVRKGAKEARTELPEPQIREPHRVTGHLRKTPMTIAHREALLEYEHEWGVEILRMVPEGYTFVRPHMSPAITSQEFAALPRFIRYRVQQELDRVLKSRTFAE